MSIGVGAQQAGQDDQLEPWLTGHLTLPNPRQLDAAAAEAVYGELVDKMLARYRITGDPVAEAYLDWPRFNTAPYLSALHGNRYVNNYANNPDYGLFGAGLPLATGTIVAKDAFTVMDDGRMFPGPLMIMEKMAPGYDPDGGDWRYTMILPDGTVFGTSNGQGAENVENCKACHAAVADRDFLYFMPEEFRP
ncbi:MAG: cytochrome P460 family protein [Alphaproteobacteria bacterium]